MDESLVQRGHFLSTKFNLVTRGPATLRNFRLKLEWMKNLAGRWRHQRLFLGIPLTPENFVDVRDALIEGGLYQSTRRALLWEAIFLFFLSLRYNTSTQSRSTYFQTWIIIRMAL